MTKTVFGSHANLAHVWAQQSTPHGRSSDGRMLFDGATIYSYGTHFPIARFVERKGKKCVLFTTQGRSISTAKHKGLAARALHGLDVPVFPVENVWSDPTSATMDKIRQGFADSVAAFLRSTPWDVEEAITRLRHECERHNAFAVFFGLRKRVTMPDFSDEQLAKLRERVAKATARREARDATRRADWVFSQAWTVNRYRDGGEYHLTNQDWLTDDDHARHAENYAIIERDKVAAWRAGKPVNFGWNEDHGTLLRVLGDEVQTSRGAAFPIGHAKLAFVIVRQCREKATEWTTNGHTIHLGPYKIDRVTAQGTVIAGCHTVEWGEIEGVARQLGLL